MVTGANRDLSADRGESFASYRKREQGVSGLCAVEEAEAEMHPKWREREDARKRLHAAPSDRFPRKILKVAENTLETIKGGGCEEVLRRASPLNSKGVLEKAIVQPLQASQRDGCGRDEAV